LPAGFFLSGRVLPEIPKKMDLKSVVTLSYRLSQPFLWAIPRRQNLRGAMKGYQASLYLSFHLCSSRDLQQFTSRQLKKLLRNYGQAIKASPYQKRRSEKKN
jgi:hypothetical protein